MKTKYIQKLIQEYKTQWHLLDEIFSTTSSILIADKMDAIDLTITRLEKRL